MKKIEVLAPAGSRESMIGAINAKADAIYLAGQKFGARAYANNFTENELKDVINYAHLRGVLVYVAVNTLIFDDEVDDLIKTTDQLVSFGVDALIVQDLGMIDLFSKRYPNTDIHASTQVNTLNIHQAKFLKELGVKRIVLARETPIEMIKQIKKHVDIELEVFVHGALCVCFSGNCLMSSMLGGRSGNRGECAQPCRLPYSLIKDSKKISHESYLLSTKDLMTLEYLDQLIDAGVVSLKIEGRMRKPEYVIQTVLSYKQAISSYIEKDKIDFEQEIIKLKKVFNRDFSKGYIFNENPNEIVHDYRPNHMGVEVGTVIDYKDHKAIIKLSDSLEVNDGYRIIQDKDYGNIVSRIIKGDHIVKKASKGDIIKIDVAERIEKNARVIKTLDHELEIQLQTFLDTHFKCISLRGSVIAKPNQKLRFSLSDGTHMIQVESKDVLEKADKKPVSKSQIIDQISKLGQTPFYFESLEVDSNDDVFISIKALNEIRRQAIDEISELRTLTPHKTINQNVSLSAYIMDDIPKMSVKVTTKNQLGIAKSKNLEMIFYEDIIKGVFPSPTCIPSKKRIQLHPYPIKGPSLVSDIGSIYTHDFNYPLYTDAFLNVTNIYTLRLLSEKRVRKATLSYELSKDRIIELIKRYQQKFNHKPGVELVTYGRVDLMISKYCPIAKTFKIKQNCHLCEMNQYALSNQNDQKFPLINDGNCNIRILNHKPINLIEHVNELMDLGISIRLDFTTEKDAEMVEVIQRFESAIKDHIIQKPNKNDIYGRFI